MRQGVIALVAVVLCTLLVAAPAGAGILRAESSLPPGESGFVSIAGVSNGTGSPHLYDQQDDFIHFRYKDARLGRPGTEEDPAAGVKIVRSPYGVPSITGTTDANLWWGAGYATAQDRLFQLELFRRATTGHLSEILGKSYVPMDVGVRRDFYPSQELDAIFARLPGDIQQRYRSYLAGVNAWVSHVQSTPSDMPAEFVALADPLRPFTLEDLAAIGVYLARTTPNGDGSELANARALDASGARALNRILPLRIRGQIATVPRSSGLFPSDPGRSRKQERAALAKSNAYVRSLPLPANGDQGTEPALVTPPSTLTSSLIRPIRVGGSYMVAIGDRKAHRSVLFNGPELGFTAPEELYEMELHGPGLNVRGITAPGAPVIALGNNEHVAWGVTSGLSGTNALYAEKLVPGDPDAYYFRGQARKMDCHEETFQYHSATTDLLGGSPPESGQSTYKLCRTVHGPVQARAGGYAYARRYATWMREAETIVGLSQVDSARTIAEVDRATARLTWNENLMAADDRGNIGYWHPGLMPRRPRGFDERLPYPGDGRAEWRGLLPVSQRPHAINPRRGWLSNWNNIPSQGWTTQNDPASERVAGSWFRVGYLNKLVAPMARHFSLDGLEHAVALAGTTAEQRPLAGGLLRRAARHATGKAAAVLAAILDWNGSYDHTDASGTVDPGAAAWLELRDQGQKLALAPLGAAGQIVGGEQPNSEHLYDVSLGQAYALRTLKPASWRRAASLAFDALAARFHTTNPTEWRAPRAMFAQSSQGAESPPPMPFFDRGTYEQFIELTTP
ncbi:MAG: penicillin amidase [Thermoleophilaceae bacterium]|nr:penicillin amidase [Thermoleophilaceae bacterium]